MAKPAVGNIVLLSFPFLALKPAKFRPALVLAETWSNEWIFCQITSKPYGSHSAIKVDEDDFESGGLPITAYIQPDALFTADLPISSKSIGLLSQPLQRRVLAAVRALFI